MIESYITNTSCIRRIITHRDCPDGIVSAMLLHEVFPNADVEFYTPGSEEWEKLPYTAGDMLMCDMSPPPERLADAQRCGVYVIDHHASAKDTVQSLRGVYSDEPGVSGAVLAYMAVYRHHRSERETPALLYLVSMIGVLDTWVQTSDKFEEASLIANTVTFLGVDQLVFSSLSLKKRVRLILDSFPTIGGALKQQAHRNAFKALNTDQVKTKMRSIDRKHGAWLLTNCPRAAFSYLPIAMEITVPKVAGVYPVSKWMGPHGVNMIMNLTCTGHGLDDLRWTVSLRSDGSIDCGGFASFASKSGGGHRGAGGFSFPVSSELPHRLVADLFVSYTSELR